MIISLFSGIGLKVSDDVAQKVDAAITSDNVPKSVKIPLLTGEPATVVVSTINGIWSDDQWFRMAQEKEGKWECQDGHWHTKNENRCNVTKSKPVPDFHELRQTPTKVEGEESFRDKWMRIIQINTHNHPKGLHYGTLRTLEDLEAYDETGKMAGSVASKIDVKSTIFPGMS